MSIILKKGKPSKDQVVKILEKNLAIVSKVIDADNFSGFTILISGKHLGKEFHDTIIISGNSCVPIPNRLIVQFFEQWGDDLIAQKLNVLHINPKMEEPG